MVDSSCPFNKDITIIDLAMNARGVDEDKS